MKTEQKTITLNVYEEGAIIESLNNTRNKKIENKQYTDMEDDLLLKIIRTEPKKVRVRREAR